MSSHNQRRKLKRLTKAAAVVAWPSVAEQGPSPSPQLSLALCPGGAQHPAHMPGELMVPRDVPLQEAHPSLWPRPVCLEPGHPVGDPGWLGSPELWETPCCFSPRLFMAEIQLSHSLEEEWGAGRRSQKDIWSSGQAAEPHHKEGRLPGGAARTKRLAGFRPGPGDPSSPSSCPRASW